VPLVVITGFLGAGKTTLVNRLLARRASAGATTKIGVIVNELGEIGIDGALLGGATRQVELPGGCVCCVLGDDLDRTLLDLVAATPDLAAIVLETSGVAEPLPIAWAMRRDPVQQHVRLAAVVALVDATHFRASRMKSVAVAAQVAYADVLLVTKAEIAGPNETQEVIAEARAIAPRAIVREGTSDEHAAWLELVLEDPEIEHEHAHEHAHEHEHEHEHEHDVEAVWIEVAGELDLEELEDQLAALPGNYLRIKGIVRADGRWFAVHRVGLRVSSEPFAGTWPHGTGRLVALGSELDREALLQCVTASLR